MNARLSIKLPDGIAVESVTLTGRRTHGTVQHIAGSSDWWARYSTREPADPWDDGPLGPECYFANLTDALAWLADGLADFDKREQK